MREHSGFMKYFKNTSTPDGNMVKLIDSSTPSALGWKHTVELEEGMQDI